MTTEVSIDIGKAAGLLRCGHVVAVPTETVYGLAANGFDQSAVLKIFEAKQRPSYNPLILHCASKEQALELFKVIPKWAEELMDRFWPGPLTLVLPKTEKVPDIVTSGKDSVAVRVPAHPMFLRLLADLKFPLAAPSANLFGRISPTSADHVLHDLSGRIPMILNGGSCGHGIESTIIGMNDLGDPFILRQGSITQQILEDQIGKVDVFQDYADLPLAPGMLKRHYAPETPSFLVQDLSKWMEKVSHLKVGTMRFSQHSSYDEDKHLRILSARGDIAEAAQNLYATMRELDQSEYDLLLFEKFPNNDLGVAINDKLDRATRSMFEIRKYFKI